MINIINIRYQIVATLECMNSPLPEKRRVDTVRTITGVLEKIKTCIKLFESNSSVGEIPIKRISELKIPSVDHEVVVTNGFISVLEEPIYLTLPDPVKKKLSLKRSQIVSSGVSLVFGDHEIKCVNICSDELISTLRSLTGKLLRVVGIPMLLPIEKGKAKPHFLILDVREQTSDLELLFPSVEEIDWVKKIARNLKSEGHSLIEHLEREVISALNIQVKGNPVIRRAVRFTVLMALSGGRAENMVLSLNLFLSGAPGIGKKIVAKSLEFLSPVSVEAHANRITGAGLVGPSKFENGKYTAVPGLAAQAHRGALIIQDFHAVDNMKKVAAIISMSAEDGYVKNSNASMSSFEAVISWFIDLNRKSQIMGTKAESEVSDLWDFPLNVLTRFDFIEDVPKSIDNQINVSLGLIRNHRSQNAVDREKRSRKAKLLVAYVKTRIPVVEISEEVRGYLAEKAKNYYEVNREALKDNPQLADFQLRMTNSLFKLIYVVSRANFRRNANVSDVDQAAAYLQSKLSYLKKTAPTLSAAPFASKIKDKPDLRVDLIKKHFKGKRVATEEVIKFYKNEFGFAPEGLKEKVYRDLRRAAEKGTKGNWQFE